MNKQRDQSTSLANQLIKGDSGNVILMHAKSFVRNKDVVTISINMISWVKVQLNYKINQLSMLVSKD